MKLQPEVAEKYIPTIVPTIVLVMMEGTRVEVDMTRINLAKADELVEKGFIYLKAKRIKKKKKFFHS